MTTPLLNTPRRLLYCKICGAQLFSNTAMSGVAKTCSLECGLVWRAFRSGGGPRTEIACLIDWDKKAPRSKWKPLFCNKCGQLTPRLTRRQMRCIPCKKATKKYHRKKWKQTKAGKAAHHKRNHLRRAGLTSGDTISLDDLADRDGWMCWLCSRPIDPNAKHELKKTHPYGLSMDHVLPLALGGTHTWDNVRIAHHICNSLRGAQTD